MRVQPVRWKRRERIFNRSIDKNVLRYTEYYGDGDTKAFSSIESVYGGGSQVINRNV